MLTLPLSFLFSLPLSNLDPGLGTDPVCSLGFLPADLCSHPVSPAYPHIVCPSLSCFLQYLLQLFVLSLKDHIHPLLLHRITSALSQSQTTELPDQCVLKWKPSHRDSLQRFSPRSRSSLSLRTLPCNFFHLNSTPFLMLGT